MDDGRVLYLRSGLPVAPAGEWSTRCAALVATTGALETAAAVHLGPSTARREGRREGRWSWWWDPRRAHTCHACVRPQSG